jgi:CubicO group peptidase (beta-lactamase class C family)
LTVVTGCTNKAPQRGTEQIDAVLRRAVEQKKLPGVVAMVATADGVVYQGAFGKRDVGAGIAMAPDSIFRIASMTKPVTSVAVMQLVEQGVLKLDEPAGKYLPELAQVKVLQGFNRKSGKPILRPPATPVTIRHLLTHTSGFSYEFFNRDIAGLVAAGAIPGASEGGDGFLRAPLVFDPGSRWEYGINTDWLGKLVEKVSGRSLDEYFRQNIFAPLGMPDTYFNVPASKEARLVTVHEHQDDGSFLETPRQTPPTVRFFSGGGGLYSTAGDYLRFTRMLLGGGQLGQARILRAETVALMGENQIGDLVLKPVRSLMPKFAKDGAFPPASNKFGLGLMIYSKPVEGGRSAGSLAWAGVYNTFFWIDPEQKVCAVILMQFLPFSDDEAMALYADFERAVYASLPGFSRRDAR